MSVKVDDRPVVIGWQHKHPLVSCSNRHDDHEPEPDAYSLTIGDPWCSLCGHTIVPVYE